MSRVGQAWLGHNCPMSAALPTNLRRILKEKGRSGRDVSLKAGFSENYVKHILSGRSKGPSYAKLQTIALELGVDVGDLLGTHGDPQEPAAAVKPRVVVRKEPPVFGEPLEDPEELELIAFWRSLSVLKKAALFDRLGFDDMPSLRKIA